MPRLAILATLRRAAKAVDLIGAGEAREEQHRLRRLRRRKEEEILILYAIGELSEEKTLELVR